MENKKLTHEDLQLGMTVIYLRARFWGDGSFSDRVTVRSIGSKVGIKFGASPFVDIPVDYEDLALIG